MSTGDIVRAVEIALWFILGAMLLVVVTQRRRRARKPPPSLLADHSTVTFYFRDFKEALAFAQTAGQLGAWAPSVIERAPAERVASGSAYDWAETRARKIYARWLAMQTRMDEADPDSDDDEGDALVRLIAIELRATAPACQSHAM